MVTLDAFNDTDNDRIVLTWTGDTVGEIVVNLTGVRTSHETIMQTGSAIFRFDNDAGGSREVLLNEGDTFIVPVNYPYEVECVSLTRGISIVVCNYVGSAKEEVSGLRSNNPRDPDSATWPTVRTRETFRKQVNSGRKIIR